MEGLSHMPSTSGQQKQITPVQQRDKGQVAVATTVTREENIWK